MMIRAIAAILLAAFAATTSAQDGVDADRALAKRLAGELKAALSSAMQVSPANAIEVCNEQAPQIASHIGAEEGVKLGRTALRTRNEANRPTDWQRTVLNEFQRRLAAGEPIANLEHTEVVREAGVVERRYMKAIATEPLCLTCHGAQLAPEVKTAIASKYPQDAATGFSAGDLRGAVYIVRRSAQ